MTTDKQIDEILEKLGEVLGSVPASEVLKSARAARDAITAHCQAIINEGNLKAKQKMAFLKSFHALTGELVS